MNIKMRLPVGRQAESHLDESSLRNIYHSKTKEKGINHLKKES